MSNPALIVRIAASLSELKANLAEGKDQIETTTAAMGKLASSFSGDKLIQHAQNVVAAVNQIGGATKLTEAEQARVNATLEKALEKYAALGREAPAGMRQLAAETKSADAEHFKLTDTVKQLALGFAAMFTARAAFNFAGKILEDASALRDLSQQTHINVEELQLLAGAMSEFGVDADQLGKGLYKLSVRIAGGDDSIVHALGLMGLSLQDVENLQGEALFLKIEHGLSTLQGSLRDTAASELFGDRLGAAMAGASEGIEGAMETARQLNVVMSEESVVALDNYGEAIERTQRSLAAMAANLMGPVAEGFNVVTDAIARGANKWRIFAAMAADWTASNPITGQSTKYLTAVLDELNQQTEQNTRSTQAATGATTDMGAAVVAADQAMALAAGSSVVWGEGMAGVAAEAKALDAALRQLHAGGVDPLVGLLSTAVRRLDELPAKFAGNWDEIQSHSLASLDAIAVKAENSLAYVEAHVDQFRAGTVEQFRQTAESARATANGWGEAFSGSLQRVSQDAVNTAAAVTGATTVMLGQLHHMMSFSNPYALHSSMSKAEMGAKAKELGGVVALDTYQNPYVYVQGKNAPPPPGRAAGGPVTAGSAYMVGERGPEVFVPRYSGSIIPNGGSSTAAVTLAAGAVHVEINYPIMDSPRARNEIASLVGDAIMARLRAGGVRVGARA